MKTKQLLSTILFGALLVGLVACSNSNAEGPGTTGTDQPDTNQPIAGQPGADDNAPKSTMKWEKTTHDFGQILQNQPVQVDFEFTNTGKIPVMLSDVKASCGCTTPHWPKDEPIKPGETSKVTAEYNAKKVGAFTKTITVTSNAEEGRHVLTIKGEVLPDATVDVK